MRYVLLDRIESLSPAEARARKCVSLAEDVYLDHFPGHPVMPGALVLESMATLGGVLLEEAMREKGRHDLHGVLTMAEKAKFRRMVKPGDVLVVEARCLAVSEDGGRVEATASVDGEIAAEASLTYAFARVTSEAALAKRREYLKIWLEGKAE